jgi:hypothetical protein
LSANPADRKSVDRILTSLKRELESGDLGAFSTKLAVAATPAVLARFRERKLLLRAKDDQRPTVAQVLRTTASRCLSSPERDTFDRYVEFSLVIEAARRKLLDNARIMLRPMPKLRTADLLAAAETVFEKFAGEITKGAYPTSSDPSVALYERRVHEVNGALNDVVRGRKKYQRGSEERASPQAPQTEKRTAAASRLDSRTPHENHGRA